MARISEQAIHFLLSIILARLLLPEEFGLVGMILVFTGFAGMFVDMGFGSALVQRQQLEPVHLNVAFLMSLMMGWSIALILVLVAPLIGQFYEIDHLSLLVYFAALNFVVIPFGMVPSALMKKKLLFNYLARIQIVAMVFAGVICVILALTGWGVWSLLIQTFVYNLSTALLRWRASGWFPHFELSTMAFRDLWGYSINLFGFNFINYWARNGDNLLIGRLLGAGALGIYTRAYSLMLLPISQVISVISSVMFSALSSIQDDRPRVKRIYLKAMGMLSFIIFPMMIGLSAVASPFILTIYGTNWAEVIPILQILGLVGVFQSIMNPVGWLYTSQGKTQVMLWWGVFGAGFLIVSILVGILLGSLHTLAICYAIANIILLYPAIAIPGRFIDMRFVDVMRVVIRPFIASAIMGIFVWLWVQMITPQLNTPLVLISGVVLGVALYSGLVFLLKVPTAYEALAWLRKRFSRKLPAV